MPKAPEFYLFVDCEIDSNTNSIAPIPGFWDSLETFIPFAKFYPYYHSEWGGMKLVDENLFEGLFSGKKFCYSSLMRESLTDFFPSNPRQLKLSCSTARTEFRKGDWFGFTSVEQTIRNSVIPMSSIVDGSFGLEQKSFNNQVGVEINLQPFNSYLVEFVCVRADPKYQKNLYKFSAFKKRILEYHLPESYVLPSLWRDLAYLLYAGVLEYAP